MFSAVFLLVYILWMLLFLSMCIQFAEPLMKLDNRGKIAAFIIFLVSAPAFIVVNIATFFLDALMGDDWDKED